MKNRVIGNNLSQTKRIELGGELRPLRSPVKEDISKEEVSKQVHQGVPRTRK